MLCPYGTARLVRIERFRNKIQKDAGVAASALGGAKVAQSAESEFVLRALGVIGANMGCKLFVMQLEVAHHLIERCAARSTSRFEPPATFGASKTPLQLNPHQLPAHGRLRRCANEGVVYMRQF